MLIAAEGMKREELIAEEIGWADLPNVVMVEVYKNLLSRTDRLNAASVCRNWRVPGFQVPLSDSLTLKMTKGEKDVPKVTFLSQQFLCKVKHVTIFFDVSTEQCLNSVEQFLQLLESNLILKTLKMVPTGRCLAYLQSIGGSVEEGQLFILKVLTPLMNVLQGKINLETFSFPMIQNLSVVTGRSLLTTLLNSRSQTSITNLFLSSLKFAVQAEGENQIVNLIPELPELIKAQTFVKLQVLSLGHDYLTDVILGKLGKDNVSGGLKRFNLIASKHNQNVSNRGWMDFVDANPECKVRLTVSGGWSLVSASANLIFPAIPLTHLRSFNSKNIRVNFLNSVIGWNVETLEHLELVDDTLNWMDILIPFPEETQFLDPIVYAAWRCKNLTTIKLGVRYCGDSLVGIARLKGQSLMRLEIPKGYIVNNSLNLRKLNKEISNALGRPWRPLKNVREMSFRQRSLTKRTPLLETLNASQVDDVHMAENC